MGIGAGILLIAVGAILTFTGHATVAGLDLRVVGWVLLLAGVAGLALSFVFWSRRRAMHTVATEHWVDDDSTGLPKTPPAWLYPFPPDTARLNGSGRHLVDNWVDRGDPTWLLQWFEQ